MKETIGTFYEFFAGGGMARAGLGPQWECIFANDFDYKKSVTYRCNWRQDRYKNVDIREVTTSDLVGQSDLAWASFPCQDLSLAGGGAGLRGDRSGTFWPFWSLMKALDIEGRPPRMVVLENVCGTLTSHQGKDFSAICNALRKTGYHYGALVIDAALFVPQSRPRLFIIAVRDNHTLPPDLVRDEPHPIWHTRAVKKAYGNLSRIEKRNWIWWELPEPAPRTTTFADLIEEMPTSTNWHSAEETRHLLGMMSEINLAKVRKAQKAGRCMVGTIYKRTRRDENGFKVQRAEIRFDDIAGCLRTPAGGSSRQLIMVVNGRSVRSRLLSTREAARLMGLPDDYALPSNYNEAYHLAGDGVAVPVVRHLAANILEPVICHASRVKSEAA